MMMMMHFCAILAQHQSPVKRDELKAADILQGDLGLHKINHHDLCLLLFEVLLYVFGVSSTRAQASLCISGY